MIARSIDPAPLPSDNKSTMGPGFAIVGTPGSPSDVAPTKVLLPRLLGDSVRFFVRLRSVATYWLVNQRHQSHTLCLTCPGDPPCLFRVQCVRVSVFGSCPAFRVSLGMACGGPYGRRQSGRGGVKRQILFTSDRATKNSQAHAPFFSSLCGHSPLKWAVLPRLLSGLEQGAQVLRHLGGGTGAWRRRRQQHARSNRQPSSDRI